MAWCGCSAYIWRTDRGQACGGIRLWQYNDMESYIRDGLRLALGMGVKSAVCITGSTFQDVSGHTSVTKINKSKVRVLGKNRSRAGL
jgi:hypothetical protein